MNKYQIEKENKGKSKKIWPFVVVTIFIVAVIGAFLYYNYLKSKYKEENAYYLAHYPIKLHVYYEDGVRIDMFKNIVFPYFLNITKSLLSGTFNSIEYVQFSDDYIISYKDFHKELWGPVGKISTIKQNATTNGMIDMYVVLLNGIPTDFDGKSNKDATITMVINRMSAAWASCVLTHEFGHAAGLDDNDNSPIMGGCNLPAAYNNYTTGYYDLTNIDSLLLNNFLDLTGLTNDTLTLIYKDTHFYNNAINFGFGATIERIYHHVYNNSGGLLFDVRYWNATIWYDNGTIKNEMPQILVTGVDPSELLKGWLPEELEYFENAKTENPTPPPKVP